MQIGVGLPSTIKHVSGATVLDWARLADSGPFGSVGVLDRLRYDSLDPLATLAAAAAVTTRVRLATTVVIGPLRNTALLAKEVASIDQLSGGRLTLGLALGARRDDYEAAGVSYEQRGQRLSDQLVTLRDIWEDESVGPRPIQPSGPDLIVGGTDDSAFARAARHADGYMYGGGPPRAFASAARKAHAAWAEAGRPGEPQLWAMGYYALGEREAVAGRDYLLDYYAFTGPFAERIADALLTTPQSIVQFARAYAEAGCHQLVLFPTSADIDQLHQLAGIVGQPPPFPGRARGQGVR